MNRAGYDRGIRVLLSLCIAMLCAGTSSARAQMQVPLQVAALDARVPVSQVSMTGRFGAVPYGGTASGVRSPSTLCHLTYYGGPIVSNVQVVPVIWGANVDANVPAHIGQFYSAMTVSTLYDFLSEYASVSGTNQSIGRGSSLAAITITPSICGTATACHMTDAQLQTELLQQIAASVLPQPQSDASGHTNTVYMVHFPANVTVSLNGVNSCAAGGFCAYHGTATYAGNTALPYGAIMDMFTSGCSAGCGSSANKLDNLTSMASHELVEAVTDTDIGYAVSVAYPIAWYSSDSTCGEIGDICQAQETTINVGADVWTVQKEWSNAQNKCTATGTYPNFLVGAPASTPAGTAFSFDLTARNPYTNETDTAFVGTVHFTSSDPGAVLPADFTFIPEDQGVASLGATLVALGSQTITAADTRNGLIVGTSGAIGVTAAADGTTLSTACPTTFVENQSIDLEATVSNGVDPGGTVTFADGANVFCAGAGMASASASCQTPALMVLGGGTSSVYNVIASYSGDASNAPSASSPLQLTVLAAGDVVWRNGYESVVVGCPTE